MRWLQRPDARPSRGETSSTPWQPTPRLTLDTGSPGRRFLQGVPYLLPKDRAEQERLDFQHYVLKQVCGHETLVPLGTEIQTILDVGTGTGRWAQERARRSPRARVIGLDVELPPQQRETVPPNYCWVQGNILQGLPFADGTFDLTHQRLLAAAIPAASWSVVVRELVRVTRVGGGIELVEGADQYERVGPAMQQLLLWVRTLGEQLGFDGQVVRHLDRFLRQEGLREVQRQEVHVPVGTWGGRVGTLLGKDMLAGLAGLSALFNRHLSLSPEVVSEVLQALPREWNQYRTEYTFYRVCGRR